MNVLKVERTEGFCYADPHISWKAILLPAEYWQSGPVDISPLVSYCVLHRYPRAKVATKLMATGISSFCLDFSPPTLITCYKISDLFWNRMNCGIGTRLNLYIPNVRRQRSCGVVARAPWVTVALERAKAKSPLGQSVKSGSPHPQPSGIWCTREAFFPLAQGRLETAPQKLLQRMSILLILIHNPSVTKRTTPLPSSSPGLLSMEARLSVK